MRRTSCYCRNRLSNICWLFNLYYNKGCYSNGHLTFGILQVVTADEGYLTFGTVQVVTVGAGYLTFGKVQVVQLVQVI